MKKKLLLLFALVATTISASAYDVKTGGIYYNILPGTTFLEVTSGDQKYTGDITIPQTITRGSRTYRVIGIGSEAFKDCEELTSVEIPISVTGIGESAFNGCTSMESIIITDNIRRLGERAFSNCEALKTVTLSNSLTTIGDYAFEACQALESIEIPDGVKTIGIGAFARSGLVGITFNCDSVTFGDEAFSNCRQLESVKLPEGVTSLPIMLFFTCDNMKKVELPASLNSLGGWAFANCVSLEEIVMNSVTPPAFNTAGFSDVVLQNALLITPKDKHTTYKAADGWSGFKNIVSPAYDRRYTMSETTLYFKTLESAAHHVTLEVTHRWNAVEGTDNKFLTNDYAGQITIPASFLIGRTKTAYVTGIDDYAFAGQTVLTEVIIEEEGVTSIGEGAFASSGVQNVSLPTGITQISKIAFAYCQQLESIEIPEGVESIYPQAFMFCSNLKTVKMPQSLRYIDQLAFFNCESLESVEMPEANMLGIGSNAFALCPSLKEFTVPEGVEEVGYLLLGAKSLKTLTLPSTLKNVYSYTICGADNLQAIVVNAPIPPLCADDAFDGTFLDEEHIFAAVNTDKVKLIVPDDSVEAYKAADVWKNFANIIGIEKSRILLGDLNGDGVLDVNDVVSLVAAVLGDDTSNPAADVNSDGAVDVNDVVTLVAKILE